MKFLLIITTNLIFDYDILWFVAQDIEHIKTLHSKTNKSIKINYISSKIKNYRCSILYICISAFYKIFN